MNKEDLEIVRFLGTICTMASAAGLGVAVKYNNVAGSLVAYSCLLLFYAITIISCSNWAKKKIKRQTGY